MNSKPTHTAYVVIDDYHRILYRR